jgi:hypothetical protein
MENSSIGISTTPDMKSRSVLDVQTLPKKFDKRYVGETKAIVYPGYRSPKLILCMNQYEIRKPTNRKAEKREILMFKNLTGKQVRSVV